MMWTLIREIIKDIIKDLKGEPVYHVKEHIPRTLGTPIRRK